MKNTISTMKSNYDTAEEKISKMEDIAIETTKQVYRGKKIEKINQPMAQ